jgi:hypothetical protein
MNGRGQRNYQDRIRSLVTISRVERYDYHWAPSLSGRIDVELNEPNLTAQRRSTAWRQAQAP